MSTHNLCFHGEIRKYYLDTPSYLELCANETEVLQWGYSILSLKVPITCASDKILIFFFFFFFSQKKSPDILCHINKVQFTTQCCVKKLLDEWQTVCLNAYMHMRPSLWWGGEGGGWWYPEIFFNFNFPLFPRIKILIFYVLCSPKSPLFSSSLHF